MTQKFIRRQQRFLGRLNCKHNNHIILVTYWLHIILAFPRCILRWHNTPIQTNTLSRKFITPCRQRFVEIRLSHICYNGVLLSNRNLHQRKKCCKLRWEDVQVKQNALTHSGPDVIRRVNPRDISKHTYCELQPAILTKIAAVFFTVNNFNAAL